MKTAQAKFALLVEILWRPERIRLLVDCQSHEVRFCERRRAHYLGRSSGTNRFRRGHDRAYARRSRRASILRFQLSPGLSSSRKT
jgi:hypothetical protein